MKMFEIVILLYNVVNFIVDNIYGIDSRYTRTIRFVLSTMSYLNI